MSVADPPRGGPRGGGGGPEGHLAGGCRALHAAGRPRVRTRRLRPLTLHLSQQKVHLATGSLLREGKRLTEN